TQVVRQTGIQCYNCKEFGHVAREYDEPKDQDLEAHYMYMEKIQEVIPDAATNSRPIFDIEPLQKVHNSDANITPDSSDINNNGEEADQDDQLLQKECELFASLIEQMKIEIDGSKQTDKSLESSNKAL
ncbi:integrase, catalytic region, zinc finger, CCHC-type containing protein, partial [Tanacetum coccineum]